MAATVKMPVAGLDLSSAARARSHGLRGLGRPQGRRQKHHHQQSFAGNFDTQRLRSGFIAGAKKTGNSPSELAAQAMAEIPAKRFGTPAEFGQTCAFLCSVHAGYITGQNILLDGGVYPAAF
jgi:3-oxoacyl-[acyl-carrier protein] reductase